MSIFSKVFASLTLAILVAPPALAATSAPDPTGNWVMHIYVGNRLFEDRVHLERGADGRIGGTVTVPGRFTSPIEKVEMTAEVARFEIIGHERGEAFRVRYDGHWDQQGRIFVGIATLPEEKNELLGGFVAQRQADAPPLAPTPPFASPAAKP